MFFNLLLLCQSEGIINTMNIYKKVIKPILFKQDPEIVHEGFTKFGIFIGKFWLTKKITKLFFYYKNKKLEQNYFGIHFKNPIGLSAGFDYNVELSKVIGDIGFAFASGGTVTYNEYEGNTKPRLKRLPRSKSLLINKGFKSKGIKKVLKNISFTKINSAQIGISMGATNSPNTCTSDAQIFDILESFKYLINHKKAEKFAYYELNISCPNVAGSGALTEPNVLENLLSELRKLDIKKPLFVKFQLEIEWNHAKELIQIMINHNVDAVIIANLLKKKSNYGFDKKEINEIIDNNLKGNFSGKSTEELSNDLIGRVYQEFGNQIKIIGVGGIFSAEDAYEKIKRGASLVQLITGMVFEGPHLIGGINKKLVSFLERDEYENLSEVIGSYYEK